MGRTDFKETIQHLSRTEKLELIQFITDELLKDERDEYFRPGETHGVWSPHDEERAAGQLASLIERAPC